MKAKKNIYNNRYIRLILGLIAVVYVAAIFVYFFGQYAYIETSKYEVESVYNSKTLLGLSTDNREKNLAGEYVQDIETAELQILQNANPDLLDTYEEKKIEKVKEEIEKKQIVLNGLSRVEGVNTEDISALENEIAVLEHIAEVGSDILENKDTLNAQNKKIVKEVKENLKADKIIQVFEDDNGQEVVSDPVLSGDFSKVKNVIEKIRETKSESALVASTGVSPLTHVTSKETAFQALVPKQEDGKLILGVSAQDLIDDTSSQVGSDDTFYNIELELLNGEGSPFNHSSAFSSRINKNKILYPEIFPGVDLLRTLLPEGVKEDIIVKNEENTFNGENLEDGILHFYYQITAENLEPIIQDGAIVYLNSEGREIMNTPAPIVFDAAGKISNKAYFEILETEEIVLEEKKEITEEVIVQEVEVDVEPEENTDVLESGSGEIVAENTEFIPIRTSKLIQIGESIINVDGVIDENGNFIPDIEISQDFIDVEKAREEDVLRERRTPATRLMQIGDAIINVAGVLDEDGNFIPNIDVPEDAKIVETPELEIERREKEEALKNSGSGEIIIEDAEEIPSSNSTSGTLLDQNINSQDVSSSTGVSAEGSEAVEEIVDELAEDLVDEVIEEVLENDFLIVPILPDPDTLGEITEVIEDVILDTEEVEAPQEEENVNGEDGVTSQNSSTRSIVSAQFVPRVLGVRVDRVAYSYSNLIAQNGDINNSSIQENVDGSESDKNSEESIEESSEENNQLEDQTPNTDENSEGTTSINNTEENNSNNTENGDIDENELVDDDSTQQEINEQNSEQENTEVNEQNSQEENTEINEQNSEQENAEIETENIEENENVEASAETATGTTFSAAPNENTDSENITGSGVIIDGISTEEEIEDDEIDVEIGEDLNDNEELSEGSGSGVGIGDVNFSGSGVDILSDLEEIGVGSGEIIDSQNLTESGVNIEKEVTLSGVSVDDIIITQTPSKKVILQEKVVKQVSKSVDISNLSTKKVYKIRLVVDTNDLVFPIDIDPSTFIKFYNQGAQTFYGDYSQGTIVGDAGFMNGKGRLSRGEEGIQIGGERVDSISNTDSLIFIDPSGQQNTGTASTLGVWNFDTNNWQTALSQAEIEYNLPVGESEVWGIFNMSPQSGIVKVTINKGLSNEASSFIDLYSNVLQENVKILLATGLDPTNQNTIEIKNTVEKNRLSTNTLVTFYGLETYGSLEELQGKKLIEINGRSTFGLDFSSPQSGSGIGYFAHGNIPQNTQGKVDEGTISAWVKTDFDFNDDENRHYVFSSSGLELYFDGGDDRWHGTIVDDSETVIDVSSSVQSFVEGSEIHIALTWNSEESLELYVDGIRSENASTWSPRDIPEIFAIGSDVTLANNIFLGIIAEPSIFNYALTSAEIEDISTSKQPLDFLGFIRRVEENNQTDYALLFHSQFQYTPYRGVGTGGGSAKGSPVSATGAVSTSAQIRYCNADGETCIQGNANQTGDWSSAGQTAVQGAYAQYGIPQGFEEVWINFDRDSDAGIAKVWINKDSANQRYTEVDLFNSTADSDNNYLIATGLDSRRTHTVRVENSESKNVDSSGYNIRINSITHAANKEVDSENIVVNEQRIDNVIIQDQSIFSEGFLYSDKGNISEFIPDAKGTISFFLDPTWTPTTRNQDSYFFDTRDNSGNNGIALYMDGATDNLTLEVTDAAGNSQSIAVALNDTNFEDSVHHIVAVFETGNGDGVSDNILKIYLDGKLVAIDTSVTEWFSEHNSLRLGIDSQLNASTDNDSAVFDFSIFSRTLSDGGATVGNSVSVGSEIWNIFAGVAKTSQTVLDFVPGEDTTRVFLENGPLISQTGGTLNANIADDITLKVISALGTQSTITGASITDLTRGGFAQINEPITVITGTGVELDGSQAGLIGLYNFNGDLIDSSGNGNNATSSGGVVFEEAKYGSGARFDGVDDQLTIDDNGDQTDPENAISLTAWLKVDDSLDCSVFAESGAIVNKWSDTEKSYMLGLTGADCNLFFNTGNGEDEENLGVTGQTELNDDVFHFIAAVYDGATLKTYVDGNIENIVSADLSSINNADTNILVGKMGNSFLSGVIDDLAIYNRALSVDEIIEQFGQEQGGYISASDTEIALDNFVGSSANTLNINGGFAKIGYGNNAEIIEYGAGSTSTNLINVKRGQHSSRASRHADNTSIEFLGSLTLDTVLDDSNILKAEYYFRGNSLEYSRGKMLDYENTLHLLDITQNTLTGWNNNNSVNYSGGSHFETEVPGQTAIAYLNGPDLSAILAYDLLNGGVHEFILNQGTGEEERFIFDSSTAASESFQRKIVLFSGQKDKLHTLRIVSGIDETNVGATRRGDFDAFDIDLQGICEEGETCFRAVSFDAEEEGGGNFSTISNVEVYDTKQDNPQVNVSDSSVVHISGELLSDLGDSDTQMNIILPVDPTTFTLFNGSEAEKAILAPGGGGSWDEEISSVSVIEDNGEYKMWYFAQTAGGIGRIGYAFSTNGKDWTKLPQNNCSGTTGDGCIFDRGGVGEWDEQRVRFPQVIKDGNIYKMWYTGQDSGGTSRIGYATSENGINWTRYSNNFCSGTSGDGCIVDTGETGDFDENNITALSLTHVGNRYYIGVRAVSPGDGPVQGVLESEDGIIFRKINNAAIPILPLGTDFDADEGIFNSTFHKGGGFQGWFRAKDASNNQSLGYAESLDGIHWTKLLSPIAEKLDSGTFATNDFEVRDVLYQNGQYLLYISGTSEQSDGSIGLLEGTNLLISDSGIVKIGNEYIKYNGIDRENNLLLNLERGYGNTTPQSHSASQFEGANEVGIVENRGATVEFVGAFRNSKKSENLSWHKAKNAFPEKSIIVSSEGGLDIIEITDESSAQVNQYGVGNVWLRAQSGSGHAISTNEIPRNVVAKDGKIALGTNEGVTVINFIADTITKFTDSNKEDFNGDIADINLEKGYIVSAGEFLTDSEINDLDITTLSSDNNPGNLHNFIAIATNNAGVNILDYTQTQTGWSLDQDSVKAVIFDRNETGDLFVTHGANNFSKIPKNTWQASMNGDFFDGITIEIPSEPQINALTDDDVNVYIGTASGVHVYNKASLRFIDFLDDESDGTGNFPILAGTGAVKGVDWSNGKLVAINSAVSLIETKNFGIIDTLTATGGLASSQLTSSSIHPEVRELAISQAQEWKSGNTENITLNSSPNDRDLFDASNTFDANNVQIQVNPSTPITNTDENIELLWHLDETSGNAVDDSGNGNTGTIASVTQGKSGKFNGAYFFDGTDDSIIESGLDSSVTGDFTVMFWVKTDSQSESTVIDLAQAGSVGTQVVISDSGNIRIENSGGPSNIAEYALPINNAQWHHIAVTRVDSQYSLYVNGEKKASTFGTTPTYTRLFAGRSASGNFYNGFIDEVSVHRSALNGSVIAQAAGVRPNVKEDIYTSEIFKIESGSGGTLRTISFDTPFSSLISLPGFNDIIGYWNFNEESLSDGQAVFDSSENRLTGTVNNVVAASLVVSKTGILGNAIQFDGTDDVVIIPDNAVLDSSDALTLSAWIKIDNTPTADEFIVRRDDAYYLKINENLQLTGAVHFGGSFQEISSENAIIEPGKWYFVAMTYDINEGGTQEHKLYVNNNVVQTANRSTSITNSSSNLFIGGNNTANSFDGVIDEVAIYGASLNEDSIDTLYDRGKVIIEIQTRSANSKASIVNENFVGQVDISTPKIPVTQNSAEGVLLKATFDPEGLGGDLEQSTGSGIITEGKFGEGRTFNAENFIQFNAGSSLAEETLALDFENNTTDNSGKVQTASTGLTFAPGRYGKSVLVNSTDTLTYNTNTVLDMYAGTISAWVRPTFASTTSENHYIVSNTSGQNGIELFYSGVDDSFHLRLGNGSTFVVNDVETDTLSFASDTWLHVAGSYQEGGEMKIYLNGVKHDAKQLQGSINNAVSATTHIGTDSAGNNQADARIDELRIFNRQLTDSEIYKLYTGNIGNSISINTGDGAGSFENTIELWLEKNASWSGGNTYRVFTLGQTTETENQMRMSVSGSDLLVLQLEDFDGNIFELTEDISGLSDGQYHKIAATIEINQGGVSNDELTLIINGAEVESLNEAIVFNELPSRLQFGNSFTPSSTFDLESGLDDIAISNFIKTPEETESKGYKNPHGENINGIPEDFMQMRFILGTEDTNPANPELNSVTATFSQEEEIHGKNDVFVGTQDVGLIWILMNDTLDVVFDTLSIISGNNQWGDPLSTLSEALRVRVSDSSESFDFGTKNVVFTLVEQPENTTISGSVSTQIVQTDIDGFAETNFTLGNRSGKYSVTADFEGNTSGVKTFELFERPFAIYRTEDTDANEGLNFSVAESEDSFKVKVITNANGYTIFSTLNKNLIENSIDSSFTIPNFDGVNGFGFRSAAAGAFAGFEGNLENEFNTLLKSIAFPTESTTEFDEHEIFYRSAPAESQAGGVYEADTDYEVIGEF